jgi:hypothetical protein
MNIIYNQISLLMPNIKISKYLKRFTIEEVNNYKKYCNNLRQQRFRNKNKELCNYRSMMCKRRKREKSECV